jgi:type II secretory pathway pseudopilin PulG
MLVAISIIVLLAGFLLVAVNRVYKQGSRTRASADLASIATALDAYKQDFGSYPQVNGANTGAAVLAKALIGPSPKPATSGSRDLGQIYQVGTGTLAAYYMSLIDANAATPSGNPPVTADWVRFSPFDGADGAPPEYRQIGFRTGPRTFDDDGDGTPDRPGGKIWGPYLPPDKFLTKPDTGMLFDAAGSPILYFSGAPTKPNIAVAPNYVSEGAGGKFDAYDNIRLFIRAGEPDSTKARARIRAVLGDVDLDGAINRQRGSGFNETAVDQPYLLWSAGADGVFGPGVSATPTPLELHDTVGTDRGKAKHNADAVQKCDDVTNFR